MTEDRFFSFKARVSRLLKTRHGITFDDCTDDQRLRSSHTAGDTPETFVDWIAYKYDLDRVDQDPFSGSTRSNTRR